MRSLISITCKEFKKMPRLVRTCLKEKEYIYNARIEGLYLCHLDFKDCQFQEEGEYTHKKLCSAGIYRIFLPRKQK